jgi:2-polyprenyl-3-methyl-5-hydroxy-6-metoxy-1,4-benzoquinol methylase
MYVCMYVCICMHVCVEGCAYANVHETFMYANQCFTMPMYGYMDICTPIQYVLACVYPRTHVLTSLCLLHLHHFCRYVLGMVPPGTHNWSKFISPQHVQRVIHECGGATSKVHTVDVVGMIYNPVTGTWHENRMDTDVNYMLIARKSAT